MSEQKPMMLWRFFDGDNTGWVAARSASEALAMWEQKVWRQLDQFRVERVPVETVGCLRVGDRTLAEALQKCVDSDQPGYIHGSFAAHSCAMHDATEGESNCGREPCENAVIHNEIGPSRPAKKPRTKEPPVPESHEHRYDTLTTVGACYGAPCGRCKRGAVSIRDGKCRLCGSQEQEPCPRCAPLQPPVAGHGGSR